MGTKTRQVIKNYNGIISGPMKSIYLTPKKTLASLVKDISPARYRIDQIWEGLYKQFYQHWEEFSNLPADLITYLEENFLISQLQPIDSITSNDNNTQKFLFKLSDGKFIEAVHIKTENRNTICISTQVGCPVGCIFCATGAAGFYRNLSADEIISQVSFFAHNLSKTGETITNIVMMGMGDPFLNYEQTVKSVDFFNRSDTFNIGARRLTISTIGIPDKIRKFAEIGKQYNLAISLHAPNNTLRQKLVPIAKKISLDSILESAQYYIEKTNRRITYEYVLIENINDMDVHAKELACILKEQNCHVNLIALNPNVHFEGNPPDDLTLRNFSQILLDNGIPTTVRNSQGAKIQAGCGQLSGQYLKNK